MVQAKSTKSSTDLSDGQRKGSGRTIKILYKQEIDGSAPLAGNKNETKQEKKTSHYLYLSVMFSDKLG